MFSLRRAFAPGYAHSPEREKGLPLVVVQHDLESLSAPGDWKVVHQASRSLLHRRVCLLASLGEYI